jgi:hypothetical protein
LDRSSQTASKPLEGGVSANANTPPSRFHHDFIAIYSHNRIGVASEDCRSILTSQGCFEEVRMSSKDSPKSQKIESLKGKVIDSARANEADAKSTRGRGAAQAASSSSGGAASPEKSNRKRWVGWNDWDAIRTH